MNAIGTKQQNRSERAATVIFDNAAQGIQDLFQGNAGSHHLEKTLFTGEQGLPSLAFADVYGGTGIAINMARCTEVGAPHPLDMLNRSVGKRDSKLQVKTAFVPNGFIETSFDE